MKTVKPIGAVVSVLLFCGFLPPLKGIFKNDLPYEVRITLLNSRGDTFKKFSIPAHSIIAAKIVAGRALARDRRGDLVCTGKLVSSSELKDYYDFDRKVYYYTVETGGVKPVYPDAGRRWNAR